MGVGNFGTFVLHALMLNSVKGIENYGVIYAASEDLSKSASFCMTYNPNFNAVNKSLDTANKIALTDLTPNDLCEDPETDIHVKGKVAAVSRGNCTFSEKALIVQKYGGNTILVVSSEGLSEPMPNQTSDFDVIHITVALIENSDFQQIKEMGDGVKLQFYAPEGPKVDYNLIVIWLLAVSTAAIGAFWSGVVRNRQLQNTHKPKTKRGQKDGEDEAEEQDSEQDTFDLSPQVVIVFVIMMCAMLVCLYFFYDYLVYVIIGLFTVASATALYSCGKSILTLVTFIPNTRIPVNRLPLLRRRPEIRCVLLATLCLGVCVWWAIERNKPYAWMLQDLLGVVFCIYMMKRIRLPNLMACTILLSMLFFYDIFFVFVTPLFTKSGQSVMVDVATGGGSTTGEMLPMVLKVPRFAHSGLTVCTLPYSLLGFGDILVPGLLLSYNHSFDLKVGTNRIYLIASVIAYGVGLVITFIALALMSQGQPALLYLVPCTLLTTVAIGWRRRELHHMWKGKLEKCSVTTTKKKITSDANPVEDDSEIDGNHMDVNADVSSQISSDSEQPLLKVKGS